MNDTSLTKQRILFWKAEGIIYNKVAKKSAAA